VIDASGRLGVMVSSAQYKRDIKDMGNSTNGLIKLRPVTFIYKGDQQGLKQYGLVAEEVDQVYPELVVRDEHGKIASVRYSMLTSMLLNELQKQIAESKRLSAQMNAERASTQRQLGELKVSNEQERAKRTAIENRLANLERTVIAQRHDGSLQAAFNK